MKGKCKKLKKAAQAAAALLLAGAMLSSCSLLPEEETFADAPTIREYEGASYNTAVCSRGEVILSERLSLNYVPLQSSSLGFSVVGSAFGEIYVQLGDEVKKGDVLAELEMGDLKTRIESVQSQIDSLELSLKQNEEKKDLALRRCEEQYSGRDAEDIQKAKEDVAKRYDQTAQSLNDSLYILNLRKEDYEDNMNQRRIIAPYDGAITYVYQPAPGEVTTKGQVVIRMADASMSLFRGRTASWDRIDYDMDYVITVNSTEYKARAFTEKELNIPETPHKEGEKGYVYFVLNETAYELSDNASGRLDLVLDEKEEVLNVPNSAITTINDHAAVYYVMESGVRNYREVEIGLVGNTTTEILSGIEEGEAVILK